MDEGDDYRQALPEVLAELDRELTLARLDADVEGDTALAAALDGMEIAERAGVSPLALWLAGHAAACAARGETPEHWRAGVLGLHGDEAGWLLMVSVVEEELRAAGAWPWL